LTAAGAGNNAPVRSEREGQSPTEHLRVVDDHHASGGAAGPAAAGEGGGGPAAAAGDGVPPTDAGAAGYDPSAYGEAVAGDYDSLYGHIPDTDATVACLAELAGTGPLLELGIGTGRLALPLAARGIDVHGVEASPAMIAELRAKPGGADIPVTEASFNDYRLDRRFSCVVLALHTIYGLPSHEEQVRCFATAAEHLADGGLFVVEANLVDPSAFRQGRAVVPRFRSADRVELQVMDYDPVSQRMEVTNVHLSGGEGVRLNSFVNQYSSPRELDLMARLGGLRLRERWGSWTREPFTAASAKHVSLYGHER
jgi:SAM-dependent methyltransferase